LPRETARTEINLARVFAGTLPLNVGVQALSFVAWASFAHVLGASTETDAYLLGLSVPALAYGIMLTAIRVGVIPGLTEEVARDDAAGGRAANELFAAAIFASAAVGLVLTAIAVAAAPLVLRSDPNLIFRTRLTIVELSPLAVLGATTGVLSAILAVRKSFAPAVAVLALDPLFRIGLVLSLGQQIGVQSVIIANLAGASAAVGVLWLTVRRHGIPLTLIRPAPTPFVRSVIGVSAPLLISASVLTVNPIIDRTMAVDVSAGAVTALDLGMRLVPGGLFVALVVAPLTATWAARKTSGGWPAIQKSLQRALTTAAIVILPLVVIGFILRHQAVAFVYHGGAYSEHAAAETTAVFGMSLLGLPAQVLSVILSTLFIVQRETIVPMKIGFANVVLNVALNFVLRPLFGVAGIALSTTLTYAILNVAQVTAARRRWGSFLSGPIAIPLIGLIGALTLGGLATTGVLQLLPSGGSRIQALIALLVAGAAGLAVYAAAIIVGRATTGNGTRPLFLRSRLEA
jgi:putative peptidoglycan lipid II flippase